MPNVKMLRLAATTMTREDFEDLMISEQSRYRLLLKAGKATPIDNLFTGLAAMGLTDREAAGALTQKFYDAPVQKKRVRKPREAVQV